MLFWIINLSVILLYGYLTKTYRKDRLFLIISCVHIGMIMAFRGINVGTDTYNYVQAFNIIKDTGRLSANHVASVSKLFLLLLRIFSFLPRTQGYMIITSIPVMISLYFCIKDYSKNYYLSIWIFITSYLFFYSMNAARHFLAISFVFLCFIFLENKKIACSIVVFLIACGLHNAVSIFVIYYFIYMIRWNSKLFVFFSIGLIGIMRAMPLFISVFVKIFPHYAWLSSRIFDRLYTSGGRTSLVYAFYSLLTVLLNLLIMLKKEKVLSIKIGSKELINTDYVEDQNSQLICRVSCIMIIAAAMFGVYSNSILISRMAYVFFPFIVFALPNALISIGKGSRFCTVVICIPLVVFMLLQLQGNYSGVLNYTFGINLN